MNHFSLASALACAIFTAQVFAASPTIKVDFDMSGRQSAEVTEPNFTRWMRTETEIRAGCVLQTRKCLGCF